MVASTYLVLKHHNIEASILGNKDMINIPVSYIEDCICEQVCHYKLH